MPLLNYTTKIDENKSISEIQKCLATHGAKAILCEYDSLGFVESMSFKIDYDGKSMGFKLPCEWRPILQILNHHKKVPSRLKTNEQAKRVGWRILKDWVEAQMAIVETKMVKIEQVFLPYAMTNGGKTVYEKMMENPQYLLTDSSEK
jgi:hypothetical protein